MTLDILAQIAITGCAAGSQWFLAYADRRRRWGFVISLCAQPFWIYTASLHSQWGIAALSVWFIVNNIRGIVNAR